jgi:hypothetical protein
MSFRLGSPETVLLYLIEKLAPNVADVAEWVKQIKVENPELNRDELAEYVSDIIIWMYTKQGAALALPGAVPGLGTLFQVSAEVATLSADLALMIRNQTYLVFAVAQCYSIKGRRILIQDALICIGLWSNALTLSKSGAIKIGNRVAASAFKRFPAEILKKINKKVGTTILTKYGTKRGGIALGKLIPFGIGVVVGGGFNYLTMKAFSKATRNYMSMKKKKSVK